MKQHMRTLKTLALLAEKEFEAAALQLRHCHEAEGQSHQQLQGLAQQQEQLGEVFEQATRRSHIDPTALTHLARQGRQIMQAHHEQHGQWQQAQGHTQRARQHVCSMQLKHQALQKATRVCRQSLQRLQERQTQQMLDDLQLMRQYP